jgi:hypothetical protein
VTVGRRRNGRTLAKRWDSREVLRHGEGQAAMITGGGPEAPQHAAGTANKSSGSGQPRADWSVPGGSASCSRTGSASARVARWAGVSSDRLWVSTMVVSVRSRSSVS